MNSLIGTFCGFCSNGPAPYRVVYGTASEVLHDLTQAGAISTQVGRNTLIYLYDEVALARWTESNIMVSGVTPILGAVVREVSHRHKNIKSVIATTRFGDVKIKARHYIDASGDAVLSWFAGLDVREAAEPIRGTQIITLEGIDTSRISRTTRADINRRAIETAERYGLVRFDGFAFATPAPGVVLVNMTHIATPLDPLKMSEQTLLGRRQADRVFEFLKAEFPAIFGQARVRSYGLPGIRQTRTINAAYTLSADDVRKGRSFDDAIARCSWPIELHDSDEESYWEEFGDDHLHYVPLRSMIPDAIDNLVVAGRCIDADPVALSSVRIIGACIAMGAAAAHACDIATDWPVAEIDISLLRERIRDNLERCDAAEVLSKTSSVAMRRRA